MFSTCVNVCLRVFPAPFMSIYVRDIIIVISACAVIDVFEANRSFGSMRICVIIEFSAFFMFQPT